MLAAVVLMAQVAQATLPPGGVGVQAARSPGPVTLDGRLDDAAWQAATPVSAFHQRIPDHGAAGTEPTEVRVLFDDVALYVGVRATDREASQLVAPLVRRDELNGGDRIGVFLDSWFDRRSAYAFFVNPAGVKLDQYLSSDNIFDTSWDATWSVEVSRDAQGWSAEFRIPLSQLRFRPGTDRFGINVVRAVARRNELQELAAIPQDLTQFVSRFGVLDGLEIASAPRRIEVMPYFTAREQFGTPTGPLAGTGGVDLRMGVGSALTLNAAINPDFGQLDGDPGQINLGPSELFLAERRPFFVEGSEAFRFGLGTAPTQFEALIYTRRIGRSPQLSGGDGAVMPGETTILGATKLTGRSGAWNVAGLAALTAPERATGPFGAERPLVEPGTVYAVGSLGRDFREGRTVLTGMGTLVRRDLAEAGADLLRRSAVVIGGDLAHRWGAGDAYQLRMSLAGSRVTGDAEAILATQQSSVRYFQRPDNAAATLDSGRTALSGVAAVVRVEDRAGDWRWSAAGTLRTPGFEANDLGFHQWSGRQFNEVMLTRRWDRLGPLSNSAVRVMHFQQGTLDGDQIQRAYNLHFTTTLPNGWIVTQGNWHRLGGYDVQALRGGPAVVLPGNNYHFVNVQTDPNKRVRASVEVDGWKYYDGHQRALNLFSSVSWRPVDAAEFTAGLRLGDQTNEPQYLATTGSGSSSAWYVAQVAQQTMAFTLRGNFTFSPTLTLQFWGEPFVASGAYSDVQRVVAPRAARHADRYAPVSTVRSNGTLGIDGDGDGAHELQLDDPDFTTASLRTNLVLRWEYRPSSTLFLVWQHGRNLDTGTGRFDPWETTGELLSAPARHQLAVKVSYWWNAR